MNVELTLKERFAVANQLVPATGTFENLVIGKDIKDKVNFTQEEIQKFEVKTEVSQGQFTRTSWNEDHPEAKEMFPIEFKELEFKLIKDALAEMSKEKKLHIEYVDLYRKFQCEYK